MVEENEHAEIDQDRRMEKEKKMLLSICANKLRIMGPPFLRLQLATYVLEPDLEQ